MNSFRQLKKLFSVTILSFVAITAFAQTELKIEEVVITATKFPLKQNKLGQAVYVINQQMIQQQPAANTSELLNQLPNMHIAEAYGNSGSIQNYSVRGGRAKDVLILVNGLPLNDDSQISNFQDLNFIPIESILRIEVINGGSSTLYGANASAGIINIILKDTENSPQIQAKLQGGKWGTFEQFYQVGGGTNDGQLAGNFSFQTFETDGFSAAADTLSNHIEDDEAERQQFRANVTYQPSNKVKFQLLGSLTHHEYDYDGGAFSDANYFQQDNHEKLAQLHASVLTKTGEITLKTGVASHERENKSPYGVGTGNLDTTFEADQWNLDLYNTSAIGNNNQFIIGSYVKTTKTDQYDGYSGTYKQTLDSDSASYTIVDPYMAINFGEIENLSVNAGARYHTQSNYDNQFVYHANANLQIVDEQNLTVSALASYNTAFIVPSLYQTYSVYGNQELLPEESNTLEFGAKLGFNMWKASVNYFIREEQDAIGFSNTTFKYANILGDSEAKGIEAQLIVQPTSKLSATAFYAKTERETVAEFYRLPKEEFGGQLMANLSPKTNLSVNYRRVGERVMPLFNNTTFMTDEFLVDPYNALDITLSQYAMKSNELQLFVAVKNVLDEELIDNLGYNYQTRNLQIGAAYQFNGQ